MKANASKRKIFDAVDMLTENTSAKTTEVKAENGVEQIAIDSIKAFHNHPFHLYEGERLNDMAAHYDKVCCQGKRNDIIRELQILSGADPDDTCCHNGNKLKSLDVIASEYGFSSRNAARYLRLNHLIQPFKNLMDENKIA